MAATKGKLSKRQQDNVRDAIKATQLIKRLQHFALDEISDQGAIVEIDRDRLKAIEILLRKSVPDLSSITLGGDEKSPMHLKVTIGGDDNG